MKSVSPNLSSWCVNDVRMWNGMTRIKIHSRVSAAKKNVRHASVLFTGTTKSPFSTPHISITTGLISIKFYC